MSGEQERIRRAANVLREMSERADAGCWESLLENDDALVLRISEDDDDPGAEVALCKQLGDASYIAAMNPLVGLALANWLDYVADYVQSGNALPAMRGLGLEQALAVAEALPGGAA